MMLNPIGETRKQRKVLTRRALADVLRLSIFTKRMYQTNVARWSGLSRSHLRAILRAEKSCSLFLLLELSGGLRTDPYDLLRAVLKCAMPFAIARHVRARNPTGATVNSASPKRHDI